MRAPQKFQQKESVTDSIRLSASASVNEEGLMDKLIDGEVGVLKPGAMPAVDTASAAGCAKLLNAMNAKAHKTYKLPYPPPMCV